jgi:hypothetical protein
MLDRTKGSNGGRSPYSMLAKFKCTLLRSLYNVSYEEIERLLNGRLRLEAVQSPTFSAFDYKYRSMEILLMLKSHVLLEPYYNSGYRSNR